MQPIVSPWLLYLVGLCGSIHTSIVVLEAIICIIVIFTIPCIVESNDEKDIRRYTKNLKIFIISFIVLGIINCIIPTKEVALQMLAASVVTPDNIQAVQGNIVDFISEVAEVIKQ